MKKVIFGIAFLGLMMLTGISVNAQEEEEPCPPGFETTQWGGVCCESIATCRHPYAGLVAESTWIQCVETCTW